ncbi:MAG: DUF4340 domain-containing protein [Methylophilaceae bacterium]|nr:DUF4340 domain-containing protein [Methylophilaceae bacterium]
MKKRWILNLILLALVGGLVAFLYLRPKAVVEEKTSYEVSNLKLAGIRAVKVEFPAKSPVIFERVDGYWYMKAPYKQRADQLSVQRILSVIAAKSEYRFSAAALAKYGLDHPLVRVTISSQAGDQLFTYGAYNTVTDEQYVAYQDGVYLLNAAYSEAATTQAIEMVDKNMLSPTEAKTVSGFDFSHLEQWQEAGLNVDVANGQWKTNVDNAKLTQNDLNEWLEFSWKQNPSKAVETYTPDRNATYPSFEVKLGNGKKIHIDKMMESPELLLARPDEGLIYHFSNDVGFTMLNPPLNTK